jgi:predicted hotdog family 3-hydroxylacyl-ACP dehydratase
MMPTPEELLPHRGPILCLDRVLARSPEAARCDQDVVEGPWVESRQLQEPGLVEAMAQAAGVIGGSSAPGVPAPAAGRLVEVRDLKVHRRPRVGETVRHEVTRIRALGPLVLVEARATVGEQVVASARLTLRGAVPR